MANICTFNSLNNSLLIDLKLIHYVESGWSNNYPIFMCNNAKIVVVDQPFFVWAIDLEPCIRHIPGVLEWKLQAMYNVIIMH